MEYSRVWVRIPSSVIGLSIAQFSLEIGNQNIHYYISKNFEGLNSMNPVELPRRVM